MTIGTGISLHVTVYLNPEDVPKFFEYFKPVYNKVVAEPECTFFEVYESQEDPGTIRWVENWSQTVDWLQNVQIPKAYYKDYLAATKEMYLKKPEFMVFNRLGPPYYTVKET